MSKSKKGLRALRQKRALARLEIAFNSAPKDEENKSNISRMEREIAILKEKLHLN